MGTQPLKLTILAGDRSGPFFQTYATSIPYFQKYNLLDFKAIDYIDKDLLKVSEVIESQRQYASESVIMLKKLKNLGKVWIAHCDDNIFEIPEGNPAKSTYVPGSPAVQRFEMIMRMAHAVTTSTPYLKTLCQKINPNVYVYRNLVDPIIETYKSEGRDNPDEIRIGWTGTPHHFDDIAPIEPMFLELVKNPKVELVFMGYAPPTVLHQIPRKRWEYYDFVPVDAFYPALANMDFDIGIAPLIEHGFNWGKTARKAQEYAILKVPMVLAPIRCYSEWAHGETCVKPTENTPEGWIKRIEYLIDNPKEATKMAEKAHDQVIRNHDIDKFVWERSGLYYKLYNEFSGREHPHTQYIKDGMTERNIPYE